jgi:hypothetical protein
MTADPIFILQALAILVLPLMVWRVLRLRGAVPLVVVQILVGIALGPTLFGRLAPEAFHLFFNPATLTPLWGRFDRRAAVRLCHRIAPRSG